MKFWKQTLATLMAVLLVLPSTCFAADATAGATPDAAAKATTPASQIGLAKELGLVKGDGVGVTPEYIAKESTRMQAAVMLLRLMGKEKEALSYQGKENFADADKVSWQEGKNMLAYLKANPQLGFQGDGTNFKPNDKITAQQYYKVWLEALGYKETTGQVPGDFGMASALSFAEKMGFTEVSKAQGTLTNADLAAITVSSLSATTKDGKMFAEKLVQQGTLPADSVQKYLPIRPENIRFEPIIVSVEQYKTLVLPSEIAKSYVENGGGQVLLAEKARVVWDAFNTYQVGTYEVKGKVGSVTVTAKVTVTPSPTISSGRSHGSSFDASISANVLSAEAISKTTLVLTPIEGKQITSIDTGKIKFCDTEGNRPDVAGLSVTGAVQQNNKWYLTLNNPLLDNAKYIGVDGSLGIYFEEGALTYSNANQSLALAKASARPVCDRIKPVMQKVYVKADAGADHNIIVVEFNEAIYVDPAMVATLASKFTVNAGNTALTPETHYTAAVNGNTVELTIKKAGLKDQAISLALGSGDAICDDASGSHAFSASSNKAEPFQLPAILKADKTEAGGTVTVQDVVSELASYDNGLLGTLTDDTITIIMAEALSESTLGSADISVVFDNTDSATDIQLASSDFAVTFDKEKLVLTLTEDAQKKIDTTFNGGTVKITFGQSANKITPAFDVQLPKELTFPLTHADIVKAD